MKIFFGFLMTVALLFTVLACSKKEAAKVEADYVFKIGFSLNGLCNAPLYRAHEKGYFEEEGLKCVVPVRAETIKAHPEETAKFLRAVQKAAKFVQEHPDEAVQILADTKRVAGDPLVNARILKTFSYRASVSQALPALERNAKDMQALGILKADVDVDKLVKDVFVVVPGVPDSLF
jgi:NitT/TauT family transport system substrate-binding protein